MKWTRRVARRIRVLFRKDEVEQELDEELRHHVAMEARELEGQGLSPRAARREALRRFGGVERTKERVRDARGGRPLEDLGRDLAYAARGLRRNPGFTLSALLVLGVGIGSATGLFGVVDAVLLEPLPYPRSDDIVRVWPASPTRGIERAALSLPDFQDWRREAGTLDGLAAWSTLPGDYPYLGGEVPVELTTAWVAGDFFQLFGVAPLAGRWIRPEEAEAGDQVVVLSQGLWERLFGSDPAVVGRTITLDHRSFEIVGVAPASFRFPDDGTPPEVWVPLTVIPEDDIPLQLRAVRFLQAVGRLAPGVTPVQARADLGRIARRLEETYPDANAGVSDATVVSLRDWMVGDVRGALWAVLGAVGFLLLLASANVANLLLARSTARRGEVALRMSLGASSGRVLRQLLTESLLLGAAGGAVGLGVAWVSLAAVARWGGDFLPRATEVSLNGTVLLVSVLATAGAAALAGILPALRAAELSPARALRRGGGRVGSGAEGTRLRRGLVAMEVAVTVILLVGAGLMVRSLGALGRVDPGFEIEDRIAMTLTISDMKHPERDQWMAIYREILASLDRHPDVLHAGAIRYLPFRGTGEAWPVRVPGLYEPADENQRYAQAFQISPGLPDALGMRLLGGRHLDARDGPDDPRRAVVNEAFQREVFQGEDPVGRIFRVGSGASEVEVVGVVADVRHRGLDEEPRPTVYIQNEQVPRIQMSYVAHTDGDPLALAADMRRMVRELDPDQAIHEIVALEEVAAEVTARPRFFATVLGAFALLALLLATLGVYGVLAYMVRSRTRETGLRLALGASRGAVVSQVLRQGLAPVAVGLGVGLLAAGALSRWLDALLFQVAPLDPLTYGIVAVVLGVTAVAACLVPARRAVRVDPMTSLRAE